MWPSLLKYADTHSRITYTACASNLAQIIQEIWEVRVGINLMH